MGFCNSGADITLAHTPFLKAILLQGTIRSTFPQLWRVACHFKQILLWKNSKVKVNLPFYKYVSDTCWLGGQCSCHYVLDDLTALSCVGVIASGPLLSDTDTVVQRDHKDHKSTLTVVRDLLQHPLFYKLLPRTPRRHLSLQFCRQWTEFMLLTVFFFSMKRCSKNLSHFMLQNSKMQIFC